MDPFALLSGRTVRLVATDLDGTLLRPDGSVGARTRAALDAARGAGLRVVFVTGRPPRWMPPVVEATGHDALAVCANGAVVVDLAADRVVAASPLAADAAAAVVARLRAALGGPTWFAVERMDPAALDGAGPGAPGARVSAAGSTAFASEPGFPVRVAPPPGSPVGPVEELLGAGPVVKLLARAHVRSGHDADTLLTAAREAVGDLAEVTHSNARDLLLEISAPGVSKASTLARLARSWGVGAEGVVAVGDMPNDLPMLAWAGVAFAVADGHPAVVAAADAVVPPPEADGVGRLLEALLR